jgi:Ca2+-binding EF-hand superfamily protein
MNMQSKAVLAITFLMVIFTQAQAQEQNRDRLGPPAFSSIDVNGDGEVDMDEFSQQTLPSGAHQTLFSHIDSDNNGVITSTEFKNHRPPAKQKR